jgi:hypothetical protein
LNPLLAINNVDNKQGTQSNKLTLSFRIPVVPRVAHSFAVSNHTNNQPNLRGRTQSKTQKDWRHRLWHCAAQDSLISSTLKKLKGWEEVPNCCQPLTKQMIRDLKARAKRKHTDSLEDSTTDWLVCALHTGFCSGPR